MNRPAQPDASDQREVNRNSLGRLLRERREELGYSRTRAAQLSNVSAASIQAWEHGRVAKPSFHDVVRLGRALQIPLSALEQAALSEVDPPADAIGARKASFQEGAPLIAVVCGALEWSDADAARALDTTEHRITRMRAAVETPTLLEVTMLASFLTLRLNHPSAQPAEIRGLLGALTQPR